MVYVARYHEGNEISVNQVIGKIQRLLNEIERCQCEMKRLQESIFDAASLQEYTEQQYDVLAEVTKTSLELVCDLQKGDVVLYEWAQRRDQFVKDVQKFFEDASNTAV